MTERQFGDSPFAGIDVWVRPTDTSGDNWEADAHVHLPEQHDSEEILPSAYNKRLEEVQRRVGEAATHPGVIAGIDAYPANTHIDDL